MSESPVMDQIVEKHGPLDFEVKAMDFLSAEVCSKNYDSLMEAMGQEKFRVHKWGDGLNKAPEKLNKALQKISPERSSYTYGEYNLNGENKRHLFVEKQLEEGVRCVFVVDTEKSKPHVYKLDNLYVVGTEGKVVDLMEELDKDQESFMVPIAHSAYEPDSKTLIFGDLDLLSKSLDTQMGIPAYVHEIGHAKDAEINPELHSLLPNIRKQKALAMAISVIEQKYPNLRKSDNRFARSIIKQIGEAGKYILQAEYNATDYARVFMTRKREQGVDLSPLNLRGAFAEQLHVALNSYELDFFGKVLTEADNGFYWGDIQKDNRSLREAQFEVVKFLLSRKSRS